VFESCGRFDDAKLVVDGFEEMADEEGYRLDPFDYLLSLDEFSS
jgi:hypothetical protein